MTFSPHNIVNVADLELNRLRVGKRFDERVGRDG